MKPKKPRKTTLWYLGEILRVVEGIAGKLNENPITFKGPPTDPIEVKPDDFSPLVGIPFPPTDPIEIKPPDDNSWKPYPPGTVVMYGVRSRDSTSTDLTP